MLNIVTEDSRIIQDPKPVVLVKELADSSVNILLRYWTKRQDKFLVNCEIQETIKQQFDSEKISIPYPTQSLYINK